MSTSAILIRTRKNGCAETITINWDGYPEHTGVTLRDKYATPERVKALFALGDLSAIGNEPEPDPDRASAEERAGDKSSCDAYHRDHGEKWESVAPVEYVSVDDALLLPGFDWVDYAYMFDGESWYAARVSNGRPGVFQSLTAETVGSL